MDAAPPPTTGTAAPASDDLYRLWLEWVTINLGRDSHSAPIAARAATHAAVQGSGFDAAVEAARKAWLSARPSPRPHSINWPKAVGGVLVIGSIPAFLAIAAVLATGLSGSNACRGCGGPIVVCPDMCGEGVVYATLSADLTRWTPGGVELAGAITSSAGVACARPAIQVGFFDSAGAPLGVVEMDLPIDVAESQTVNWDVNFWPPPDTRAAFAYALADGTRIFEEGLTGPIPTSTAAARVVNTKCLAYAGEQP